MGFYMERFRTRIDCTPAQANTDGCFLGFEPVVRRFMLEVDGKWGPFFRCNPLPFYNPTDGQHVDTKHWGCFPWHGRAPTLDTRMPAAAEPLTPRNGAERTKRAAMLSAAVQVRSFVPARARGLAPFG